MNLLYKDIICVFDAYSHRIIELLRLEKASKTFKSNRHPNTTMPAKPHPEVPYLYVFLTLPGMVTPPRSHLYC